MEKTYSLTRAEIVEAFRRWDAAAVEGNWPEDHNHDVETAADTFLEFAGFGGPTD